MCFCSSFHFSLQYLLYSFSSLYMMVIMWWKLNVNTAYWLCIGLPLWMLEKDTKPGLSETGVLVAFDLIDNIFSLVIFCYWPWRRLLVLNLFCRTTLFIVPHFSAAGLAAWSDYLNTISGLSSCQTVLFNFQVLYIQQTRQDVCCLDELWYFLISSYDPYQY